MESGSSPQRSMSLPGSVEYEQGDLQQDCLTGAKHAWQRWTNELRRPRTEKLWQCRDQDTHHYLRPRMVTEHAMIRMNRMVLLTTMKSRNSTVVRLIPENDCSRCSLPVSLPTRCYCRSCSLLVVEVT